MVISTFRCRRRAAPLQKTTQRRSIDACAPPPFPSTFSQKWTGSRREGTAHVRVS